MFNTIVTATLIGSCFLCEQIRERNRNAPPPEYEFYEDYLEAQRAEGKSATGQIDFSDDNDAEEEE